MSTRYISVLAGRSLRETKAYLYGGTEVIDSGEWQDGTRVWALLETTAPDDHSVDFRATYQTDRLNSGMLAARTFSTQEEARAHVAKFVSWA